MRASAGKYLAVFRISWQKELEYRFNFFLGRLRSIVVLLLLYFVWITLTARTGRFAGYSRTELVTYVFGLNVLRALVFGTQSRQVASEINDGTFSSYLVMPISFFSRTFSAELSQRALYAAIAFLEVLLFVSVFDIDLHPMRDIRLLGFFAVTAALAVTLYFLLSYLVSLLAFWTREAMGPRFLFDWVLEFASGAYFPLDILSPGLFSVFAVLPFASLTYFPMQIYLGRLTTSQAADVLLLQLFWIGLTGLIVRLTWKKGLRKYTGEGM